MPGGMPLPPHHRRRVPSSQVAAFIDRGRVDALLLPLVPDLEDRAFVLRCLLDEGPAPHRGANYVLVALLGEVVRRLGEPASAPARPTAVPMRLPPHLGSTSGDAYYPLSLDLSTLALLGLPLSDRGQLVVFLVSAAPLTGLFSAGPSMAALLDVAEALAKRHPPEAVYVGLAMAVCAGSSLFLTAATAGPLAQALTERAALHDSDGSPLRLAFFDFVPVGLLGFGVILTVDIGFALTS